MSTIRVSVPPDEWFFGNVTSLKKGWEV